MNGRMTRTNGSRGCEKLTAMAVSAALLTLTACGGGSSESLHAVQSPEEDTSVDLSNLQDIPSSIRTAIDGTFSAESDVAEVAAGDTIEIGILNNDNLQEGSQFKLLGQPENGKATLLETGEVEYTANSSFEGTDLVEYALVAPDGTVSTGTLYIAVCADCDFSEPVQGAELAATDDNGNPYCQSPSADPDGDGFGWENNLSCVVPPEGTAVSASLTANTDDVTVSAGSTVAVSSLRNDIIPDRESVEFDIDAEPTSGVIEAADAGVVVYSAPENFSGTDSMVYRLTDRAGNTSVTTIDFNVECASCITMEGLRLSWPANPAAENVESYRVFFGPDENMHTSTALTEVRASDFTGSAPNAVYDIANDLNVTGTEGGCFRVTAVRGSEESEPSDPICFKLG